MGDQSPQQLTLDLDGVGEFHVRVSDRARRAQIRVLLTGDVEVVVPRRFGRRRLAAFVSEHRQWLDEVLDRVRREQAHRPGGRTLRPERVELLALGRQWAVRYRTGRRCGVREVGGAEGATLDVRVSPASTGAAALQQWLTHTARASLGPWLEATSRELGLSYGKITIRCQKTRWGSCSVNGDINLNRNLLFLPPHLVRYLFVHELAHTVHLDHSARYWRLVQRFEPDCDELERSLKSAERYVPLWAYP